VGARMLVRTPDDWSAFRNAFRNSVILDPAITRIADLFLSGASSVGDQRANTWNTIERNIGALAAFIDAIVLYPTIPVIGYEATYGGIPPEIYADIENLPLPPGLDLCADVLKPVGIFYEANQPLYAAAIDRMDKGTRIPEGLAAEIETSLQSLSWAWTPGILDQAPSRPAGDNRLTNAFLYSGLMFSSYAKEINGDQLLSPELSTLFAMAAVEQEKTVKLKAAEEATFRKLSEKWNASTPDFPRALCLTTPSFLPFLLRHDPPSIGKLIERALKARDEPGVREYRAWRNELREDLAKGRITQSKRRNVEAASTRYARRLAPKGDYIITWNISVSTAGPSTGISGPVNTAPLRDWMMDVTPGKKYQKILVSLAEAAGEYFSPADHLKQLWDPA
jgi:hypothetical protein